MRIFLYTQGFPENTGGGHGTLPVVGRSIWGKMHEVNERVKSNMQPKKGQA